MAGVAAQLPQARMPASALRLLGDDRLFRLASAGDERAFEVIYERHHQALYRYCRSIVGNPDDAADALQSTMASALRGLVGEAREIPLRPWLFRIAHNESISLLRKRRPHVAIDDALELEAPVHDPAVKQRLKDLVADLRELPDGQRGALVMHELSGLRYRDVATALGTTEPHARQLVYEARTAAAGAGAVEIASTTHHSSRPDSAAPNAKTSAAPRSSANHNKRISTSARSTNLAAGNGVASKGHGHHGLALGRSKTGHPAHPA